MCTGGGHGVGWGGGRTQQVCRAGRGGAGVSVCPGGRAPDGQTEPGAGGAGGVSGGRGADGKTEAAGTARAMRGHPPPRTKGGGRGPALGPGGAWGGGVGAMQGRPPRARPDMGAGGGISRCKARAGPAGCARRLALGPRGAGGRAGGGSQGGGHRGAKRLLPAPQPLPGARTRGGGWGERRRQGGQAVGGQEVRHPCSGRGP